MSSVGKNAVSCQAWEYLGKFVRVPSEKMSIHEYRVTDDGHLDHTLNKAVQYQLQGFCVDVQMTRYATVLLTLQLTDFVHAPRRFHTFDVADYPDLVVSSDWLPLVRVKE